MVIGFLLGVAITWTAFGVAFWALLLEERAERSKRVLAMTRMLDAEQEDTEWLQACRELGYEPDGRHRDVRGW